MHDHIAVERHYTVPDTAMQALSENRLRDGGARGYDSSGCLYLSAF